VTERVAFTVREAAAAVGVDPRVLYQAIHARELMARDRTLVLVPIRAYKVGRAWRILRDDLVAWVRGQEPSS